MNQVFDAYAHYYDLLYRDKDYAAEAEYVASLIRERAPQAKTILELGCGTGAHAEHLARMGYIVHGIDQSKEMLSRSEARKASLSTDIASRLSFSHGDIRTVRSSTVYDVVISLFHVMSYQTTNNDLIAAFETADKHLGSGGLFLFDFWHGPAVLTQKPDVRVKRLEDPAIKVTRVAEPVMHMNESIVEVNYTLFIETKTTGSISQVQESHRMRYLFLSELACLSNTDTWANSESYGWMGVDAPLQDDWAAITLMSKK